VIDEEDLADTVEEENPNEDIKVNAEKMKKA